MDGLQPLKKVREDRSCSLDITGHFAGRNAYGPNSMNLREIARADI